ncbi:glycine/betaine ABC transporter permease, partial [Pontibaca sp. S1109L]|nr:glycine/betaine ABC transporter permease [Pontibaca salina]
MATYDFIFDRLGLRDWCGGEADFGPTGKPLSMADLMAQSKAKEVEVSAWDTPFPSLDALHDACAAIPQSRALTRGLEEG